MDQVQRRLYKVGIGEFLEEIERNLIRDLGKSMKKDSPPPKELDDFDIYAKALAVDLRKLSQRNYYG